jgi:hypothetical protein
MAFSSETPPFSAPVILLTQFAPAGVVRKKEKKRPFRERIDLPTEFFKWREMATDRNQLRAICSSKMPSATKETPTSSRQDIFAELRYGNVPL